jgi:hypothetical protein
VDDVVVVVEVAEIEKAAAFVDGIVEESDGMVDAVDIVDADENWDYDDVGNDCGTLAGPFVAVFFAAVVALGQQFQAGHPQASDN